MNSFSVQLRTSVFRWVAPFFAFAGFFVALAGAYPLIATSDNIAESVEQLGPFLAPVIAAFAAWDGLRDRRHDGGPLLDTGIRSRATQAIHGAAASGLYVVVSWFVILIAVYVRAISIGLHDGPDFIRLARALLVFVAAVAIGHFAAAIVRHWSAVLVAAAPGAIALVITITLPAGDFVNQLLPLRSYTAGDFYELNASLFLGQIMAQIGVIVLLFASLWLADSRERSRGLLGLVLALSLGVSGAVMVGKQNTMWGTVIPPQDLTLSEFTNATGSLKLFAPAHYTPVMPEVLDHWTRVQAIFADTPAAFTELRVQSDSHPVDADGFMQLYLTPRSANPGSESVLDGLYDLRAPSCDTNPSWARALAEFWIAGTGSENRSNLLPDDIRALAALRAQSPSEETSWMREHFEAFETCELTLEDFPAT